MQKQKKKPKLLFCLPDFTFIGALWAAAHAEAQIH
jgi:hypothetical protein